MELYTETDSQGRRFRRVGDCIEYEPVIMTTRGSLTQTQLQTAQKTAPEKIVTVKRQPEKTCPFKSQYNLKCDRGCQWYSGSECLLRSQESSSDTALKKCPVSHRTCLPDCVMMDNKKCLLLERLRGEQKK